MSTPLHPVVTVSNIRNYIPITLEIENGQHTSWVELFIIYCHAFQVLNHILPPAKTTPSSTSEKYVVVKTNEQWPHLDVIVLQWICGIISRDLLITILAPG